MFVDVPQEQYMEDYFVLHKSIYNGDVKPWNYGANGQAYRFRPYGSDFDSVGRRRVLDSRMAGRRWQHRSALFSASRSSEGHGDVGMPVRESYLTRMAAEPTPAPSKPALMERSLSKHVQKHETVHPLSRQRDVGRVERIPPFAGKRAVDSGVFPYRRSTADWYEYEITQHKLKRFTLENDEQDEVTHKIVISALWDHHARDAADDIAAFVRDVGKQVIEAKLTSIRGILASLNSPQSSAELISCDKELKRAFTVGQSAFSPELRQEYDFDEIAQLLRRELVGLESRCLAILAKINSTSASESDVERRDSAWPVVERLEPWIKMVEHWQHTRDSSFTDYEMSTRKHEFRRYFRVVKIQLPFQSPELEKRILDTRHWLHRHCTAEYHSVSKANVVCDHGSFPVERDPATKFDADYHRLLSFAFDWQTGPAAYQQKVVAVEGDTWTSLAARLGVEEKVLRKTNPAVASIEIGRSIIVPKASAKRMDQLSPLPGFLTIRDANGPKYAGWTAAAEAVGCEVDELKAQNPAIAQLDGDTFPEEATQLKLPIAMSEVDPATIYAATESVFESDTFESVASRIGCTAAQLQAVNPTVKVITDVTEVLVPAAAKRPRRVADRQLRPAAATAALLSNADAEQLSIPDHLPTEPEGAAVHFPAEYNKPSTAFPPQPQAIPATESWLSYTAKYLDRDLSLESPQEAYNLNPVWPTQQVPGRLDSTPFEEDQTWLLAHAELQSEEMFHPEGYIQDMHRLNNEQFPQSLQWQAP